MADRRRPARRVRRAGGARPPGGRRPRSMNVTGSIALRPWQHDRGRTPTRATAFALRDPLPWADLAGLARDGEGLGYAARVPAGDRRAGHARRAHGPRGRDRRRSCSGPASCPMPSRTPSLPRWRPRPCRSGPAGGWSWASGPGRRRRARSTGSATRRRRSDARSRGAAAGRRRAGAHLPSPVPVPIWISALGPRAMRLAGEIADGVLLNWCTPERVAAARAAGPDGGRGAPAAIRRRSRSPCTSAPSFARAARRRPGRPPAEYASYPGVRPAVRGAGDRADAPRRRVVPSAGACVDAIRRPSARERLEAYREAGADLPVVYPVVPGGAPDRGVRPRRPSGARPDLTRATVARAGRLRYHPMGPRRTRIGTEEKGNR